MVKFKSVSKDYFEVFIVNKPIGVFERSEIRHIIEQLDKIANH